MTDRPPNSARELVDVVDEHDRVVATVTRAHMRAGRLRHRAVGIVVLSSTGRLLVHRRADHKDVWPGLWDVAVGGVVCAGETYEAAARRELAEELGVVTHALTPIAAASFDDDDVSEIARCFSTVHDGPFRFTDDEVAEVRWVDASGLGALRAEQRFVPDSTAMLEDFLAQIFPFGDLTAPL